MKQDITVDSIKISNNDPLLTAVTYGDTYTVRVVIGGTEYGVGAVLPCGATVRFVFAESAYDGTGDGSTQQPTNAGLYEVALVLSGADAKNYNVTGINLTSYNIAKRVLSTSYVQEKAFGQTGFKPVYTGKEQGVSATRTSCLRATETAIPSLPIRIGA